MTRETENPNPRDMKALDPEEVLLKYWPQISYRVKNSIGRSTPDWEDVAGEILLAVVESLRKEKFRGESSLGTFIYSITTNKIIDHIRQKKKFADPIPESSRDFDPYLHVEAQERVRMISRFLKQLKPKYADVLYLYYYLDMSQCEIAKVYGISAGTMNSWIKKARNTLKKLMKSLPLEEAKKQL